MLGPVLLKRTFLSNVEGHQYACLRR